MGEQDCLGQSCDRWETGPTVGAGIIETPSEQLNGRLMSFLLLSRLAGSR